MNTNLLKKFAQETRIRLLEAVEDKLNYILNGDSAGIRDYADAIQTLKKDLKAMGKEALIDKVAYTWFNRLMALRFMDVNDYQPLGLKVISPKPGYTQPELLDEATQGHIPEELDVDRQRIHDLLDGNIDVLHPQNEVYRMLLVASCNYLYGLFPFLFEKIRDYTELLLPDDLISELSILQDFVKGMMEEDCQQVEILGWLYQFYISELNNELISSRRAYKKNELAPASQLFTPKWIVQYMVDNTLGQIWAEMNPSTQILEDLEFYITPEYKNRVRRKEKSIEEIKLLEPCVGSGHILAYAFDIFYKIYEEEGYTPSDIPLLILKHNLYGIDIDPRAVQIATFTLLMKGREKHRRFFRKIEKENFTPHIYYYEDFPEDSKFNNATALGSLIQVNKEEADSVEIDKSSLFGEKQQRLKNLYQLLSRKYDVVVTNPPYINSSRMEPSLKEYVNQTYPETKTDLFACFILRCLELTHENGLTGYMTPFVWMFISSYQRLREIIIDQHFINNLIQLEYSGFDGATVPICTFTLRKTPIEGEGNYIRLSDFKGSENQAPKTLEAIQNPECGWFYVADQKDFEKIPGSNIGYWLGEKMINIFSENKSLNEIGDGKQGLATADNHRFLRFWSEISINNSFFSAQNIDDSIKSNCKWFPYNKAGELRRWYGNQDYMVNWKNDGHEIRNFKNTQGKQRSAVRNPEFYFRESISWGLITSAGSSFRFYPNGFVYDVAGMSYFPNDDVNKLTLLGSLNTKLISRINKILNPTINLQIGDVIRLPFLNVDSKDIENNVIQCISISQQEWNSRETSWDFEENELIRMRGQDIEEAIALYKQYWTKKFIQLHRNEEDLNARFIEIYGLQEEMTPDVPLTDITILREELDQRKLKKISGKFSRGWELVDGGREAPVDGEMVDSGWGMVNGGREAPVDGEMVDGGGVDDEMVDGGRWMVDGEEVPNDQAPITNYQSLKLPFDEKELVKQFISYAVGCMMGRYSLDKPGLILANQGEGIADYVRMVDSGWGMVDGGQWIVDGGEGMDGKNLKNIDNGKGLQGTKDLATRDGSSKDGLSGHEKDAERGTIQPDGSDQTGSRERTEQYSRRTSERNPGISSLSSDRTGITGRAGDPADPDNKSRNAGRDRSESNPGSDHQPEKANLQSAESAEVENKIQPLITKNQPPFMPDDDGIIPVLDSEWFEDDIVTQFRNFVRVVWGEQNLKRNMEYIEKTLGKPVRDYFYRDFYDDHVRRYKKRPIYWLFTSPDRSFQALVYLHRYNRDTLNILLNDYLRPYIHKLENHVKHLNHLVVEGSAREQTRARKEIVRTEKMIEEARKYDRDVVYPLALRRIEIDLDDGVLVNYNKFGEAVKRVQGLNDPKKKAQVKKFDWIDGSEIV